MRALTVNGINFQNLQDEDAKMASMISRYIRQDLTKEERAALREWVYADGVNEFLFVELTRKYHKGASWREMLDRPDPLPAPTGEDRWFYALTITVTGLLIILMLYRNNHSL